MARSVDFYTRILGMNLLRTTNREEQKYSLAFMGFGRGNEDGHAEIEHQQHQVTHRARKRFLATTNQIWGRLMWRWT